MSADLPIHLLEGLVAIADTGTFTAAATQNHVSQPALSQSIRRLERIVGTRLVDRRPSGATLTPAGISLAADGRNLIARLAGAIARATRAGDGSTPPELVVGFGTTTPSAITDRILGIREEQIRARIRLEHVPWGQEAARLLDGHIDVALFAGDSDVDREHVSVRIGSYPRLAVFPATHPLASRSTIRLNELDDEPIVDAGSDRNYWLALPRPSGAQPPVVEPAARTVEEMLAFVSAGRGMAITSASVAASTSTTAVRFVLIEDLPPATLELARLRDDERPRVLDLLELLRSPDPARPPHEDRSTSSTPENEERTDTGMQASTSTQAGQNPRPEPTPPM